MSSGAPHQILSIPPRLMPTSNVLDESSLDRAIVDDRLRHIPAFENIAVFPCKPSRMFSVSSELFPFVATGIANHRAGKETDKRDLTLVDDTCTEISITLWGSSAKADESRWEGSPVVAFKGVKVSAPDKP